MFGVKGFLAKGVCGRLVASPVAQQRVGQHQDLSGYRDDGYLRRLAASLQRRVVGFHARAMTDGGEGGLVQSQARLAAPPADVTLAGVLTAVVVERSQADQGRDLLAVVA